MNCAFRRQLVAFIEFSAYCGQDYLGHAVERQRGKKAVFTADDNRLGTYASRRTATGHINAAAK